MADITITIPDAQIEPLELFVNPLGASDTDEARMTALTAYAQEWINKELWNMAKRNAINAVSDPTV
jgi:hypothetical protein